MACLWNLYCRRIGMADDFVVRFAPLQGYTDAVYRQAHARLFGGVERYYSPFLRVEHGEIRQKEVRDIAPENNGDVRMVPQFIASDKGKAERILTLLSEKGYQEVDFNLGCPFPVLARRHNGSGMLPYPDEVEELLTFVAEKFPRLSLSVKLRLGWDNPAECLALLPLFNRLPLSCITLHPRLGKQQYKGSVDMEAFSAFYEACDKPLFYNGDLRTVGDIDGVRRRFPRLAGVVVGRGLLGNPALALEYGQGHAVPGKEKMERIRQMHSEILDGYSRQIQGGEAQLLSKMKTLWDYLLPDADRKARKAIFKATRMEAYLSAVCDLLKFESDSVLRFENSR